MFDTKEDVFDSECFCLTTSNIFDGASAILYPEKLEEIREIIGEDYYILPTSIHDCMVVRKSFALTHPNMKECLNELNNLEPLDFLSDNVYEYLGEEKRLMIFQDFEKEKEKPRHRDHER